MNPTGAYDQVVRGHGRLTDPHALEWERTYSMFVHLALLVAHIFVPVVPTLVMWLIKRDQSPFVDDHGREALNFQFSLIIYFVGSFLLGLVTCGVGMVLMVPVYALAIVGMILASIAAHKGQYYRYPMTIRFMS